MPILIRDFVFYHLPLLLQPYKSPSIDSSRVTGFRIRRLLDINDSFLGTDEILLWFSRSLPFGLILPLFASVISLLRFLFRNERQSES